MVLSAVGRQSCPEHLSFFLAASRHSRDFDPRGNFFLPIRSMQLKYSPHDVYPSVH